jgi:glyoxylase-like metal-dependent hydrolase (beta-lactamase superfamily II)
MTRDAESIDFKPIEAEQMTRPLGVHWIHGSESAKHNTDPDIHVHWYDEYTVILRQNMAINYEAPFMFLLFGGARAVLIDTGATASPDYFPLRIVIDSLVTEWLARHPRNDYPLLVLHSHSHGDHVAGDGQFATGHVRRSSTQGPQPSPITWDSRPTWIDQSAWTWAVARWTALPVLAITRPRSLSMTRTQD